MNLIPYPKYKLIDETILDTEWLFSHSMKQNINRADILVRMLAIDNYYQKNDFGFQLYNTMQRLRCKLNPNAPADHADYQDEFIKLIRSFENGYDYRYPIILNRHRELLDGSHRLSLCLYNNISQVPVLVYDDPALVDYSLEWFISNGLNYFEPFIRQKYYEVTNK